MNAFNKSIKRMTKFYGKGGLFRHIAMFIYRKNRLFYSADIPPQASLYNVNFLHKGLGCVISKYAVVKDDTIIQHGVTIGTLKSDSDAPCVERGVYIGAKATVLGKIRIGEGAKIGAGALVINDVPDGTTAIGVPARIINKGE